MPALIVMKTGAEYRVEKFRDDVVKAWELAITDGGAFLATYDRLGAGVPLPKVTIDLRDVSAVEESRR